MYSMASEVSVLFFSRRVELKLDQVLFFLHQRTTSYIKELVSLAWAELHCKEAGAKYSSIQRDT